MTPSSRPHLSISDLDLSSITNLSLDSRTVRAGDLFLGLPGSRLNGAVFANEAADKGASALLVEADTDPRLLPAEYPNGPKIYRSHQPLIDAAIIASIFYGSMPSTCSAVTGTNGKTSVAWFHRLLMDAAGKPTVSFGTLGVHPPHLGPVPSLTSPDPVSLHRALKAAHNEGYEHVVIEASSHGLDQHRLAGLDFDAVAFTNFSQDHLDYHETMDSYRDAKLKLLSLKKIHGQVITNADDPTFSTLEGWSYGFSGRDARILRVTPTSTGIHLRTDEVNIEMPLIGSFQAHNVLCAWLMTRATGTQTKSYLETLSAVPGRMEAVAKHEHGGLILVDYAHTHDALASALRAARDHTQARVICVFGAGGNRDKGKRALMGNVAKKLADLVFITDDNPRFEKPELIRETILSACPHAIEIADRRKAIASAIAEARAGDIVLIAGKGHETGQTIGSTTRPFDDRKIAREIANQSSAWQVLA